MDKLTILFIRACKANNSTQRLLSVHRRFYAPVNRSKEKKLAHIACILARICDEYLPLTAEEIMGSLLKEGVRTYTGERKKTTIERALEIPVHKIRYCKVDVFPGFIKPAFFRVAAK